MGSEDKNKSRGNRELSYDFQMNHRRSGGMTDPEGDDWQDVKEETLRQDRYEEPDYREDRYEDDYADEGYEDDYAEGYDENPGRGRSRARHYRDEDDYYDTDRPYREESGLRRAGQALGKGFRFLWNLLFTLMQIATALAMLYNAAWIGWNFWKVKDEIRALGPLSGEEPNKALLVCLGCGAFLVLFAVIQFFWIMTRPMDYDMGEVHRIDTGRGTFAFALYLIMGMVSIVLIHLIPEGNEIARGVRQVVNVTSTLGREFLMINAVGLGLCLVRRLRGLFS